MVEGEHFEWLARREADGEKHDVPEMKWTVPEVGVKVGGGRWGKYFGNYIFLYTIFLLLF